MVLGLSNNQLLILITLPFIIFFSLTFLYKSEAEESREITEDISCSLFIEDDGSLFFTLRNLPSESQPKVLELSKELHEKYPRQGWDKMLFVTKREMIPVDNIRWSHIQTLALDFHDYFTFSSDNDFTHIQNLADNYVEIRLPISLFVNHFIHNSPPKISAQTTKSVITNMNRVADFSYTCSLMTSSSSNTMQCIPCFVFSRTIDQRDEAIEYSKNSHSSAWISKIDDVSTIYRSKSVTDAIGVLNIRSTAEGIVYPVLPNLFELRGNPIFMNIPILITSLDPFIGYYTPEIFSVFLDMSSNQEPSTTPFIPKTYRLESLVLFEKLDEMGLLNEFTTKTMSKIENGIREYLYYDTTFERDVNIPSTSKIFERNSKSFEMISCQVQIDSSLQPYLLKCETDPLSYNDLRQSEVLFDELHYILVAEYAEKHDFQSTLRYWKELPSI